MDAVKISSGKTVRHGRAIEVPCINIHLEMGIVSLQGKDILTMTGY